MGHSLLKDEDTEMAKAADTATIETTATASTKKPGAAKHAGKHTTRKNPTSNAATAVAAHNEGNANMNATAAKHAPTAFENRDPLKLVLNPENERDYDAADPDNVSLRQSLKSEGILTPLEIYEDDMLSDGHRRLFNIVYAIEHEQAGELFKTVPVLIVPKPANEAEAVIHRLNKNEAKQFSALEQAKAFSKLRLAGMNNADMAKRVPFSAMHIGMVLTLHDSSEEIKDIIRNKEMSSTLVMELLRSHSEDVIVEAVKLAKSLGKKKATQTQVDAVILARATPVVTPSEEVTEVTEQAANTNTETPDTSAETATEEAPWSPSDIVPAEGEGTTSETNTTEAPSNEAPAPKEIDSEVEVVPDANPANNGSAPAASNPSNGGTATPSGTPKFTAGVGKDMLEEVILRYNNTVKGLAECTSKDEKLEAYEALMAELEDIVKTATNFGLKPSEK